MVTQTSVEFCAQLLDCPPRSLIFDARPEFDGNCAMLLEHEAKHQERALRIDQAPLRGFCIPRAPGIALRLAGSTL